LILAQEQMERRRHEARIPRRRPTGVSGGRLRSVRRMYAEDSECRAPAPYAVSVPRLGCSPVGRCSRRAVPALTESASPDASDWSPCHCCGRFYLTANMVRLHSHPDDALCVGCVAWLYDRSRPIVRKLYPIWRLPARIRAWRPPSPVTSTTNAQPPPIEPSARRTANASRR
jgi:hypothetical protein